MSRGFDPASPRDPAQGGFVDRVAGWRDDELRSRLEDCIAGGASERHLGLRAHAQGHLDAAADHLRAAVHECEAAAIPVLLAQVRFELAGVLIERDVDGDRDEAARLLGRALTVAEELTDRYVAQELADIGDELSALGELERQELAVADAGLTFDAGSTTSDDES